MADLHIAEIPFENGQVQHRYARYLSDDGSRWIRHGLFRTYYEDGTLASEGNYVDGKEDGLWTDYHRSGKVAARGTYAMGIQAEDWQYWDEE